MALTHYIKNRFDGKGSPLKKCDIRYLDALNPAGDCNLVRFEICVCSNAPTADRPKLVLMKFSDYVAAVDPNGVFADLVAKLAADFPGSDYRVIRPRIKKDLTGKEEHEICFELVPYQWLVITAASGLGEIVCVPECDTVPVHRSCPFGVVRGTIYQPAAEAYFNYDSSQSPSPTNQVPNNDDVFEWEALVTTFKICCTEPSPKNSNPCPAQEVASLKGTVNESEITLLPGMDPIAPNCLKLVNATGSNPTPGTGTRELCLHYEMAGNLGGFAMKFPVVGPVQQPSATNPIDVCQTPCPTGDISHPWITP